MPAPVVVFAFNRPPHLRRTLEALAANDLAAESDIIIFCDGPRHAGEKKLTDAVRKAARDANSFQSVKIIEREKNYGLAKSIIDGVTEILKEYESIIVLEDDLVSSPFFLQYMNDALNVYADDDKVCAITGWCFPHNIPDPPETFFLLGNDCWSWGTWRRGWNLFEEDAGKLIEQLEKKGLVEAFTREGSYDYMGMLKAAQQGRVSSWAVRWLASAILHNKYYLSPGRPLVRQIGSDGSGTNVQEATNKFDSPLSPTPIRVQKQSAVEHPHMREANKAFLLGLRDPAKKRKKGPVRQRASHMHRSFKDSLKKLLARLGLRNEKRKQHKGNVWVQHPSWQSACAAAGGYDSDSIFQKVLHAARMVRDGQALWERDSVLFYQEEYNLPLLVGLMSQAAANKGRLSVLDFGGALGSTYMQNRVFLDRLERLEWHIVEQPHFVARGREEFSHGPLHFWETMESCFAERRVDAVIFSSVLQYMDEPYALLEQVCAFAPAMILLDRTPFAGGEERFFVQNVPEHIYKASYACRFLDRSRVRQALRQAGYRVLREYPSPVDPEGFFGLIAIRAFRH